MIGDEVRWDSTLLEEAASIYSRASRALALVVQRYTTAVHGDQPSEPGDLSMQLDSQLACDLLCLFRVFRFSGSGA